jgi:3-oxoacyl-(acyl-carrier-protein) synthase
MFVPNNLYCLVALVMWCATFRSGAHVAAFSTRSLTGRSRGARPALWMSTTSASVPTQIIPRVKAADANEPSDGPVLVKGWVRTLRKQKTLAFVEVNDGSNLSGIQCVLSFNDIDDVTKEGKRNLGFYRS